MPEQTSGDLNIFHDQFLTGILNLLIRIVSMVFSGSDLKFSNDLHLAARAWLCLGVSCFPGLNRFMSASLVLRLYSSRKSL